MRHTLRRRYGRSITSGTRVRVTSNDSMYRGWDGAVVTPDARRTARLGGFERRLLATGGVLVERANGALFVVPVSALAKA